MEREDELPLWEQHKSPAKVARYMRDEGRVVGRTYKTHGDVWNVEHSLVQVGLLHLILDELELIREGKEDPLEEHIEWLEYWKPIIDKLLVKHRRQKERLIAMFHTEELGKDLRHHNINLFSCVYRADRARHRDMVDLLREKVERMASVKSVEQIINLKGIGKKTAAKIINECKKADGE